MPTGWLEAVHRECSPREGARRREARRLATEVGASTRMAVYTHFGSMDELLLGDSGGRASAASARRSPGPAEDRRPDRRLGGPQGWAYRQFTLDNRHLYRVMFGDGLVGFPA